MNLRRLGDEVQSRVSVDLLATADGSEPLGDFEVEVEPATDLLALDGALRPYTARELRPADDGEMALAVRDALGISARQAADRNVWWWLALRRYPGIVRSRWERGDGDGGHTLSAERMLGQVNRNAFARLWWGAEMVRTLGDPAGYTKMLFGNQDLFEAVIGRSLARYPPALQVILEELSPLPGKTARELVRDLQFLLSTLVLEAVAPNDLREELKRLRSSRR